MTQPSIATLLRARLSRRQLLAGGSSLAAGGVLGSLALSGCDGGRPLRGLGFPAIPFSREDRVTLPPGYAAQVVYALGDPLAPGLADYSNDGSNVDFDQRSGDHHDGMSFFPLPAGSDNSAHGLLALNHENITQDYLHPAGATTDGNGNRPLAEVRKEISAHGVSVVEVARSGSGYTVVRDSPLNRRITPNTVMRLAGPVAGSALVQTAFSPDGTQTRGTLNNCANGYTPWGTYLSCEENWHGYFKTDETNPGPEKTRYGVGASSNYGWETASDAADSSGELARYDTTPNGASARDDYRNEANGFGWIVEIDPYDPAAMPVKRTALGRFRHEGCWPSRAIAGQPLAFYMGDDNRGDYIYKFVTAEVFQPGVSNGDLLDQGTLYVARFDADGSGEWIALDRGHPALAAAYADQAELLVNTRSAADLVGATPMDRPEWAAINPANGEVYLSLTNNSQRGSRQPTDAANPRDYDSGDGDAATEGNVNGHIIRWRENGDDPAATRFQWDIYLFAARPDAAATINLSQLDAGNSFSSPDGLWFDPRGGNGILWIQTDDSAIADLTNNQILAAIPGQLGDGDVVQSGDQLTYAGALPGTDLRRFLVGPRECEITGIDVTPDGRAMFVNIQHPGENGSPADPSSHWPGSDSDATVVASRGQRPRSATIVITRNDGGRIGE